MEGLKSGANGCQGLSRWSRWRPRAQSLLWQLVAVGQKRSVANWRGAGYPITYWESVRGATATIAWLCKLQGMHLKFKF
eukprot:366184-Chlamydomonas_euryale.AAC.4